MNFGGTSKARRWGLGLLVPLWLGACSGPEPEPPPMVPPEPPAHCLNNRKDPKESGVDCGGEECPRCNKGDTCIRASDCADGACSAGFCQDALCGNGRLDMGESDVDCGGYLCLPCGPGSGCTESKHCTSLICLEDKCTEPSCVDGVKNGDEIDVDCGGGCAGCWAGTDCQSPSDCASNLCEDRRCSNACAEGSGDCDADYANACETDTRADAAHCGACGKSCALENAEPECVASQCQVASCAEGFDDCNAEPSDGCEVDLLKNPEHCGGCERACSENHAVADCRDGTCALTCDLSFEDCDHDDTNGCEVSIATDPENCGHCGTKCDESAPACRDGACH